LLFSWYNESDANNVAPPILLRVGGFLLVYNRMMERGKSVVVDYDVFYTNPELDPGMKEGWYFWFIDQNDEIVSEPIGPFADADDVMRSGKVAVSTYYDHDDES
jgi:hypothetical protein